MTSNPSDLLYENHQKKYRLWSLHGVEEEISWTDQDFRQNLDLVTTSASYTVKYYTILELALFKENFVIWSLKLKTPNK